MIQSDLPNLETLEIGSSSCFFSHIRFENLPRLQSLLVGFEAGGLSSGVILASNYFSFDVDC